MKKQEYTPEEIAAMHDRNEHFVGKRADMTKLQRFQKLKAGLLDFMEQCDDAKRMEEIAPNDRRQNAVLYLDFSAISTFNNEEAIMLAKLIGQADHLTIASDGSTIRFSFGIQGIWSE